MSDQQQDERIAKRASTGEARASRSAADRQQSENRETSDATRLDEKLAMLRDVNTKLPTPPEIPGYHLCWLTTNNQSDPLEHRFRLGYQLVNPNELPGFAMSSQQAGQGASDRISVNEMVLAKIDNESWLRFMTHLHHDQPQEMARNLRDSVTITEDGKGRKMAYTGSEFNRGISDGYDKLGRALPPRFVGVG